MTTLRRTRWLLLAPVAAAVSLVAAACGGGGTSTSTPTSAATSGSTSGNASGATVATAKSSQGTILVDGQGRTLYLFEKDKGNVSSCYGGCAQSWPPFTTNGNPRAGSGAGASLVGTTNRTDGKTEVTYNGHPLYYYVGDSGRGQTNGQGLNQFGAKWYVLSPQGDKVEKGGS